MSGSSPLTRGKPTDTKNGIRPFGLIPAHAGKTIYVDWATLSQAAHPRSRGENADLRHRHFNGDGSSPLTRGKLVMVVGPFGWSGLIPAHAGKTILNEEQPLPPRAHPRSRGENGGRVAGLRGVRGSSPLTRGKPW